MYLIYEYKNNCGNHIWAYILWYIHYFNVSPCEWDIYIGLAACNQIESFNSYCQWVQQMTTVDQGTVSVNDQHHLMVTYSLKKESHLPNVWCCKDSFLCVWIFHGMLAEINYGKIMKNCPLKTTIVILAVTPTHIILKCHCYHIPHSLSQDNNLSQQSMQACHYHWTLLRTWFK